MDSLWLDDRRPVPDGFNFHAANVEQAKDILSNNKISHISFDHDLGEDQTGYDLAKWIRDKAFRFSVGEPDGLGPMTWAIHTDNPVGRQNIYYAMLAADSLWGKDSKK